ncbi:MAG TPA: sodium:proton antiporter [Longimicrobiales bacterium]|nr:sodium:proton antiporter [Longimicrobiales bacterium]
MTTFDLASALVTLAALLAWANHRYVRLPPTIGVMVLSMLFSLALVGMGGLGFHASEVVEGLMLDVDFSQALLNGMLGALLFAGALHLNLNELREKKLEISVLATVGVLLSTAVVGVGAMVVFRALGLDVPTVYCFLFGALISPTDPIAVGAILKTAGVPQSLQVKISGESLFNDGVGVVLFILILEVATGSSGHDGGSAGASLETVLRLLAVEVGGGLLFGLAVGWIIYRLLRSVDNYQVEVLLTLAIATGGYSLAHALHVSGPLAMVVAGLLIGNHGRLFAMSPVVVEHMYGFWELVDELLNAVLFVLIGLEVLVLDLDARIALAGLAAIPLVLLARFASVGLPVSLIRPFVRFSPHAVKILTWSGLRGGISVALALSLPAGHVRDILVTVTYVVVVFSILVQGLSVGPVARRLSGRAAGPDAAR